MCEEIETATHAIYECTGNEPNIRNKIQPERLQEETLRETITDDGKRHELFDYIKEVLKSRQQAI